MTAKKTSLVGMIIGAVCLFGVFVFVMISFLTKDNFNIGIDEALGLLIIGMSPSVPFCPVYVSIIFDKIRELKTIHKELENDIM